ncbi:MAG: hypothetical protein PHU21_00380 [Elusimicrobia bacterium]|nr:hypothetical protein [Elusimicrobiota bacterium]
MDRTSAPPPAASPLRGRLAALALGAVLAVSSAAAAEWACAILLTRHGPLQWGRPRPPAASLGGAGRGIFVAQPPPPAAKEPRPRAPVDGLAIEDVILPAVHMSRMGPGLLTLPRSDFRRIRRFRGGGLIWDLTYRIDEFSRRDTPGERSKARAERFVVLLGDSFVFGEGVGQDETLAAFLGRELPWARVYNYGIGGLYLGELLERLRLVEGPPEIRESRGTAVYVFTDNHLTRQMGSLREVGSNGFWKPYYHEDAGGRIVADRYIKDARPFWTLLARIFVRSAAARYLNLDYPTRPTEPVLRFLAKLIGQIRGQTQRFGADRFYVVFYPGCSGQGSAFLKPYLEKEGIPYLDLSDWDLERLTPGPAFIAGEGHPTAQAHQVMAAVLAQVLRQDRGRLGCASRQRPPCAASSGPGGLVPGNPGGDRRAQRAGGVQALPHPPGRAQGRGSGRAARPGRHLPAGRRGRQEGRGQEVTRLRKDAISRRTRGRAWSCRCSRCPAPGIWAQAARGAFFLSQPSSVSVITAPSLLSPRRNRMGQRSCPMIRL